MTFQSRQSSLVVGPEGQEVASKGHQLWITTRQLAEVQGWSMAATYSWLHRHGIVRRGDGRVCRRDVQRELDRPSRRGKTAGTVNNLRAMAARRRTR